MVDEWEDGWMNEWLNGYIYFTDHMPACIIICFGKIWYYLTLTKFRKAPTPIKFNENHPGDVVVYWFSPLRPRYAYI